MLYHDGPLWLIGAGNMGGAMLRGWLAAGLDPALVTVIRPRAICPRESSRYPRRRPTAPRRRLWCWR